MIRACIGGSPIVGSSYFFLLLRHMNDSNSSLCSPGTSQQRSVLLMLLYLFLYTEGMPVLPIISKPTDVEVDHRRLHLF
ncbi:protein trichome birefringence-like 2 isoform X2 [Iris pallida]|uniref:Protein trichome birefringence-like 2 isoform X2 n=1 Tax=Iris pallida TaxID=29817 RepID=A0AAX6HYA3_IRIPA|nr:protein trichome birefringence-like 2 isoform X2 [Iris pallida]